MVASSDVVNGEREKSRSSPARIPSPLHSHDSRRTCVVVADSPLVLLFRAPAAVIVQIVGLPRPDATSTSTPRGLHRGSSPFLDAIRHVIYRPTYVGHHPSAIPQARPGLSALRPSVKYDAVSWLAVEMHRSTCCCRNYTRHSHAITAPPFSKAPPPAGQPAYCICIVKVSSRPG